MRYVLQNLKKNEIISSKNVEDIKRYISIKYPGHSREKSAHLLANTIHKIIESNIADLEGEHKKIIKGNLIIKASRKNYFSINAYEIFREYIKLDIREVAYLEKIIDWVNRYQSKPIDLEELSDFLSEINKYNEKDIDLRIYRTLENMDIPQKSVNGPDTDSKTNRRNLLNSSDTSSQGIKEAVNRPIDLKNVIHIKSYSYAYENGKRDEPVRYLNNIKPSRYNAPFRAIKTRALNLAGNIFDSTELLINNYRKRTVSVLIGIIVVMILIAGSIGVIERNALLHKNTNIINPASVIKKDELDQELKYSEVNIKKLTQWLNKKNSLLADKKYLNNIIYVSKKYDINPLFILSITGQEQGFVPKNDKNANLIVNNPFNVYGSWTKYNTNLRDSCEIAAKTIINLSRDKPDNSNQIQWINRKYAEDKNWWIGVTKLFLKMKEELK